MAAAQGPVQSWNPQRQGRAPWRKAGSLQKMPQIGYFLSFVHYMF
jgi:hypothetical protein